jgi:hypothetical protein
VQLEELGQLKKTTSSRFEPAIFWLAALLISYQFYHQCFAV